MEEYRLPISNPQVVVVGCCFLDYKSTRRADDGVIRSTHHGGVGRNVAENLARLGIDVGFITLANYGLAPRDLFLRLEQEGIRIAACEAEHGVGEFRVDLDQGGNLVSSSATIPELERLTWSFAGRFTPWLSDAKWIVLEMGLEVNLLVRIIDWAAHFGVEVCGLPTRLSQVGPRWELLRRLDCLVLNVSEASMLLRTQITNVNDAMVAARHLVDASIPRVAITMGPDGVFATEASSPGVFYPACSANAVDATGAGDAFSAGLIASLVEGRSFKDGIAAGLELARRTVETRESVALQSALNTNSVLEESGC